MISRIMIKNGDVKDAIERLNKEVKKEVAVSKNPTMGDSKLTIEDKFGEIRLVQVDRDGAVSTIYKTYFANTEFGLYDIFYNVIYGQKDIDQKIYSLL